MDMCSEIWRSISFFLNDITFHILDSFREKKKPFLWNLYPLSGKTSRFMSTVAYFFYLNEVISASETTLYLVMRLYTSSVAVDYESNEN